MRAGVLGAGATGARIARQLLSTEDFSEVIIRDHREKRLAEVLASLGSGSSSDKKSYDAAMDVDVMVLAGPNGTHTKLATRFLAHHIPVVSVGDGSDDIRGLLSLKELAQKQSVPLVIGAGFMPGLTCLLTKHAASELDRVDEIHIAKVGTGGPECAKQHHEALAGQAQDWRDGEWISHRGGSGRELYWFPDPIGGVDCYRADLADTILLADTYHDVQRITARVGARRRDRLTARLPMMRPPHEEGGPGAIRVEVRGMTGGESRSIVYGAMERPAVGAGVVAAVSAQWIVQGKLKNFGAGGLANCPDPVSFLQELARRGVKAAAFQSDM